MPNDFSRAIKSVKSTSQFFFRSLFCHFPGKVSCLVLLFSHSFYSSCMKTIFCHILPVVLKYLFWSPTARVGVVCIEMYIKFLLMILSLKYEISKDSICYLVSLPKAFLKSWP